MSLVQISLSLFRFCSLSTYVQCKVNTSYTLHHIHHNNPTEHHFNFNTNTENETLSIFNKLKSKNTSGKDEISNKLLESIQDDIAKPLTIFINQSLKTGIFPNALIIAKVKPLYKKFDNFCLNNYRPISLLPTISKIFERVMFIQLFSYLLSFICKTEQQYGFRS